MNEIEEQELLRNPSHGDGKLHSRAPSNAWASPDEQVWTQEKHRQGLLDCDAMGNGDTLGHDRTGKGADDDYKVPFLLDIFMKLTLLCLRLVCSKIFQNFITFVIILASVMVGIQTYPSLENNQYLSVMDSIILYIFTAECVLKILAAGLKPWEYVYDADGLNFWNVFDFLVVIVCYLPLDASMVTVIRLFRLLRVLKLVRTLPELQILVMGLLGSIYSIFYVALLLCLVYYLYGIMLLSFFKENDPVNFHDLQTVFLTLFRMSTMDDWTDIMYSQMYGNDIVPCDNYRSDQCTTPTRQPWLASMMCVTFIVLSSFVVLNLFIGVVAQQMEEAKDRLTKENERRANMAGCEDEFEEDERTVQLIVLRFDDLIAECDLVQEEANSIRQAIEVMQKRQSKKPTKSRSMSISRSKFGDGSCKGFHMAPGGNRPLPGSRKAQGDGAEPEALAEPPGVVNSSPEEDQATEQYRAMVAKLNMELEQCEDDIEKIGHGNGDGSW